MKSLEGAGDHGGGVEEGMNGVPVTATRRAVGANGRCPSLSGGRHEPKIPSAEPSAVGDGGDTCGENALSAERHFAHVPLTQMTSASACLREVMVSGAIDAYDDKPQRVVAELVEPHACPPATPVGLGTTFDDREVSRSG